MRKLGTLLLKVGGMMTLIEGHIYIDATTGKEVEFGYMGQTGLAIVYSPGERNMQDSYGIDPSKLVCRECRRPFALPSEQRKQL